MQRKPRSKTAIEYAIKSLTRRPQTEFQIRAKVKQFYPESDVEAMVDRLKELNYVDDADFVDRWIRHRSLSGPRGTYVLQRELVQKGVEKSLVDEKLLSVNEATLVADLMVKKWPQVKGVNFNVRKQKMARFLASRGFNPSTVWDAVGKLGEI